MTHTHSFNKKLTQILLHYSCLLFSTAQRTLVRVERTSVRAYIAGAVELVRALGALAGLPARPLEALADRCALVVRESSVGALFALVAARSLRHVNRPRNWNESLKFY